MKRIIKKIVYGGLLPMLLASCLFMSCSDDVIEDGNKPSTEKMGSVTFRLDGISGSVSTRSEDGNIENLNLSDYQVKAFVFRHVEGQSTYQLYKEQEVSTSLVTITDISKDVGHIYVFVAVPEWAGEYLELKCYSSKKASECMELDANGIVTKQGTDYKECYVPVFEEPEVNDENYFQSPYYFKVRTNSNTGEDFKIYAWGAEHPVAYENSYTPDRVILAPQFGKIRFQAGEGQTVTSCNVYSNVYRFYMTQVVGAKTVENGMAIFNATMDNTYKNDYLANYENGNQVYITKTFGKNSGPYEVCMPCTTLGSEVPSNTNELANTFGKTAWQGSELEGEDEYGWPNPTSVTIGGQKIVTKESFPIFRQRTTVLGIKDDNTISVSFTSGEKPGLGLDDDIWDGIN